MPDLGNDVLVAQEKEAIISEDKRDKILLEPVSFIIKSAFPNVWEELANAFNYWIKVPEEILKEINSSYRKFHYSNILTNCLRDDSPLIEDDKSSCPSVYGFPHVVNSSIQISWMGGQNLVRLSPLKGSEVYVEALEQTSIARYMELEWNETLVCPSETEYFQMILKQTFGHFGSQIKFMQLCSKNQNNLKKLIAILGLYVRILEDYQHFISIDGRESKFLSPDVSLATFSLPIIHAVKSKTKEGAKLMDILRRRSNIKEVKTYAVSLLKNAGSFTYTKKTLMKLKEEALLEIGRLEKNPALESVLEKYFKPLVPADTSQTELPEHLTNNTSETICISSYLKQTNNVQSEYDEYLKKMVSKPFDHLRSATENNYVAPMFFYFGSLMQADEEKVTLIKNSIWICIHAVYMVDDMQDSSVLRKGLPCSYLLYGRINVINSMHYSFSLGLKRFLALNQREAPNIFFELMLKAARGQGMDVYRRDNFVCPTEEEYIEVAVGKTGSPLALLLNAIKMNSPSKVNIEKLPAAMALFFQTHDDYENLTSQKYYNVKGFCEDLSEGKFGFPTMHAINTYPKEGKIIMDILKQRTDDVNVKKHCLSILKKCGSFEYTRNKLKEFRKNMFDEMKQFPGSGDLIAFIDEHFRVTLDDAIS